ncbi:MAG: DsbA family protein [Persicimonas sp.]
MLSRSLLAALAAVLLLVASCAGGEASRADQNDGADPDSLTSKSDETAQQERAAVVTDSDLVPVDDSPVLGPNDAPVTLVVFSEFQCPFCARGAATIDELMEQDAYEGKIRLVYKHFPLPFHRQAKSAARAAMAAGEQGKFWQMHDLLFDNQVVFRGKDAAEMEDRTAEYARELGLDVERFRRDFERDEYAELLERDVELGQEVGVRGTPHILINGEPITGAQPLSDFEAAVDEQLELAEKLRAEGVTDAELYRTAVARNFDSPSEPEPVAKPPEPEQHVEMVPVDDDDAMRGDDDALVTIVAFSEFQCPFCKRAGPTVDRLVDTYGDKVRLVFKHNPLPFHPHAMPAAKLALAAGEQGKFWQMHDLLFDNQSRLSEDGIFVELGEEIGLSKKQVEAALASDELEARIEKDRELAEQVDARGTPTFFINGVKLVGARSYEHFETLVDAQLELAETLAEEQDLSAEALYEAAVDKNKEEGAASDEQPDEQPEANDAPRVDTSNLSVDDDQVRGPEDAKVTIFVFSDFECPYCMRGAASLDEALEEYGDEVKVIFKHFPLPFHRQAKSAARAAMAAGEQGKFWQMHDLLFEHRDKLGDEGTLIGLAEELELDVDRFEADMKEDAFDKQIDADMQEADTLGVRGTPTFFIDGTRMVGAKPAAAIEQAIEEALAEKQ